ncbi:glycosyl hydrolase 53 [Gloeophyllum trabeum ATCC 11539]|uniref:Arabinogalactan endo-beta-1,4-galactanase n=1 Tax=Gloeophyllum trabeum (strain ATCC 11539 / FP-39264 / Madison 617) TaxID=670483 RepID=S7Q269_GLOTA|nr:glycosyl hydrolase 53 [Gloeophyllum trabeum ATCC 11539]EPQ53663.1 glycosyl hydrolase 53 [Gloeophyllum trabeum ATCC 11539]
MVTLISCLTFLTSLLLGAQGLQYKCADFSSLLVTEAAGVEYSENGSQKSFETILASHGTNLARIRVWTAGDYDVTHALAIAKRAEAAGMSILVDLHYSDTWADPGKQAIPSGWPTDLNGLNTKIYAYTKDVVTSFANQGTPASIIQLLHSAANGARAGSSSVKTMIHLANGWDRSSIATWYKNVLNYQGAFATGDVDIMGFSFYPFYNTDATLSALQSSMSGITSTYKKPFMIVETDWPVQCSGVSMSESSIPISASGQETWVADIRNTISNVPGASPLGICYWEPGWIGNANLGSGCADNLLVSSNGATRSSIKMFSSDM